MVDKAIISVITKTTYSVILPKYGLESVTKFTPEELVQNEKLQSEKKAEDNIIMVIASANIYWPKHGLHIHFSCWAEGKKTKKTKKTCNTEKTKKICNTRNTKKTCNTKKTKKTCHTNKLSHLKTL